MEQGHHCAAPYYGGHREAVETGGVVADDRPRLVGGHVGQDLLHDGLRARKRRLGVRVVGAPHQRLDADDVAHAHAVAVLLEAGEAVAVPEVGRERALLLEPVPLATTRPVRVGVVHLVEEERDPRELVLDRADPQPREPLEHAGEDEVGDRLADLVVLVDEHRRRHVLDVERERGVTATRIAAVGCGVEADRQVEVLRARPERVVHGRVERRPHRRLHRDEHAGESERRGRA